MEDRKIYYGAVQAHHGHDYVFLFTEEQMEEEFRDMGGLGALPKAGAPDGRDCDYRDIFWPMGGSNVSATFIKALEGAEAARDFLTQDAFLPDLEDPMLIDTAEYAWSIDTGSGCAKEVLDAYGLKAEDYGQSDPRADEICSRYGITRDDLYGDRLRDVRLSEADGKLPGIVAEMKLPELAREAFELEEWFTGVLSGGIGPARHIQSVDRNEDGSVSVTYRKPETFGLSDVRYHNDDTDEHTVTYSVEGGRLLLDGGEIFPSISGWGDPEYEEKARGFYSKWNLEAPEWLTESLEEEEGIEK